MVELSADTPGQSLRGKTVVLGISGGIAAYKAAELCRLLVKAGATVRVVMTEAATRFIAPLTLQTLSGAPVATSLVDADEEARIGHIQLADAADLIVVAPATADTIARFAGGRANDLLAAVVLASHAPVLLAPAMNVNMWENPLTQQNLAKLVALERFSVVGPASGELACGWQGQGRLIEPQEILVAAAERVRGNPPNGPGLGGNVLDLAGRRVVITAGPTVEPIDDVRFIANRSSGKMGFALAEAAARRGAEVTLIAGPVALPTPTPEGRTDRQQLGQAIGKIVRIDVETALEMQQALQQALGSADVVVMAAAVADFRPAKRAAGKLSRRRRSTASDGQREGAASMTLSLAANPDLLAEIGAARRGRRPLLVGFAAEVGPFAAGELAARAHTKLLEKKCDVIVANDVARAGTGFGSDDNAVTVVFGDATSATIERAPKLAVASAIWDRLVPQIPPSAAPTEPGARRPSASMVRMRTPRGRAPARTQQARGRRG